MKGFLDENSNKDKSGKRLAGFITLGVVLIICLVSVYKDPNVAGNIVWPLVSLVGVLFGVSVVKDIGGGKK